MSQQLHRILGIETSCDETAAAIVEGGSTLLSSIVASQADIHANYGGVFPEVASRQHILAIHSVVDRALQKAHMTLADVDAIAVTRGPGLAGSLVVGVNMAKGLALSRGIPFIGINHLEGHIYSAWVDPENPDKPEPKFPLLALLVSGGHTELILVTDHLQYQRLGGTLDDAAGEAFDKVARLLGLSYPGGPAIQMAAESGDAIKFQFPRAWLEGTWNFSFSGLKTAVLREVRRLEDELQSHQVAGLRPSLPVADLAAGFQDSVVDVLVTKTLNAAEKFQAKEVLLAGGVSANRVLRQTMLAKSNLPVNIPPISQCTDNAVMIATAGYFRLMLGQCDTLDVDILPTWPLPSNN